MKKQLPSIQLSYCFRETYNFLMYTFHAWEWDLFSMFGYIHESQVLIIISLMCNSKTMAPKKKPRPAQPSPVYNPRKPELARPIRLNPNTNLKKPNIFKVGASILFWNIALFLSLWKEEKKKSFGENRIESNQNPNSSNGDSVASSGSEVSQQIPRTTPFCCKPHPHTHLKPSHKPLNPKPPIFTKFFSSHKNWFSFICTFELVIQKLFLIDFCLCCSSRIFLRE